MNNYWKVYLLNVMYKTLCDMHNLYVYLIYELYINMNYSIWSVIKYCIKYTSSHNNSPVICTVVWEFIFEISVRDFVLLWLSSVVPNFHPSNGKMIFENRQKLFKAKYWVNKQGYSVGYYSLVKIRNKCEDMILVLLCNLWTCPASIS